MNVDVGSSMEVKQKIFLTMFELEFRFKTETWVYVIIF